MIVKRQQIRPWMFKKEMLILYYGLNDRRTGLLAKLPAVLSVLYLLSPIDLLPDFIPFLGYVDDLLVVPLLINLAIRFLPADVREESLLKANRNKKKFNLLIFLLILLLISALVGIFFLIRHLIQL